MGNRLSKIVTKTGDDGTTGIAGNIRLPKYDPRIEAIGAIDELNSLIGIGLAHLTNDINAKKEEKSRQKSFELIREEWITIQHHLFNIGGELAMPEMNLLEETIITALENNLINYNEQLTPLKEFILPSGSFIISQTHYIRAVTRRCERLVAYLKANDDYPINPISLKYLNRLSDYFFVMARFIAKIMETPEIYWQSQRLK